MTGCDTQSRASGTTLQPAARADKQLGDQVMATSLGAITLFNDHLRGAIAPQVGVMAATTSVWPFSMGGHNPNEYRDSCNEIHPVLRPPMPFHIPAQWPRRVVLEKEREGGLLERRIGRRTHFPYS